MTAHYLFEPDFCNVASGWEKGIVEKNVQDSRRRVWIEAKTQVFSSFAARQESSSPRIDRACVFTKRFLRSENAGFPTSRRVIARMMLDIPLLGSERETQGRLGHPQALAVA